MEADNTIPETADQEIVEAPQETEIAETEPAAPSEEDAAFEAGFATASGEEPEPEPAPLPELEIAGFTESQIKDLLTKVGEVDRLREAQAKAFGTLGSLKQSIDALRSTPKPTATQVKVTKESLKRLSEAFPEMAEMIAEDLSSALQGTGSAPSFDPKQYEQMVEQRVSSMQQNMQRQMETKLLSVTHPDWQTVVPTDEFKSWAMSLPDAEKRELATSWDSGFISRKLSEYKSWKDKTVAQSTASKRSRLEQAITPKGSVAPQTATEEDAFMAGFKAAIKKR
jgi:hypothetical protein